ncbi:unnamed protein product [Orchesella dallaii]|uniref:Uncharacterized protein n=1 Tax=Orchesella dallaii TaxID=48710 RepID=A0ABP1QKP2_9HEXA
MDRSVHNVYNMYEQERYDDYMEMREGMDLANVHFKESLISWASPDNPPWFAKAPVFWLCNFLLLSWPLRLILELNTAHVHYQVNKLFGVNYMSPSGSELLLSAPRSHGLPINNHQHRIHNRAISSHHSRLRSHHNRRRSVVAASEQPDQDDTAPLLFSGSHHDDGEQQQNQYLNQGNINKQEKDPSELQGSSKNLNKDQQTSGTNNNNTDTSPSSSSGRVFFPQWRNSFFTRNFRFAGQGGYKLTRSVTLLMTKPERLQFLASTQHQFPDEFGYYGDSDEGTRLLQDYESSYYPSCSSPPPPPFLTPSPSENQCTNVSDRRLTNHNHEEQRNNSLVTRSNNSTGTNNNSNNGCLAPSYSEALLLMEPNERHSVLPAYSSNEPNPPNSSLSPPPPPSSRANCDESGGNSSCDELGFPANLTNERDPSGFMGISGDESTSLANEVSLDPTPVAQPSRLHSQSNSGLNERAHYPHQNHHNNCPTGTITSATDEDHDDNAEAAGGDRDDNLQHSGNEVSLTRTRSSVAGSIGETSRHHHPAQQSCCVSNGHENDLYNSQERSASTTSSSRAQRQHTHHHHQSEDQPCSSSSASSVTSHYQRASTRLLSAGSSMVLNTVAPREMTGVQIDLTQPIVVTVPRDPLRESGTVDSSSSSYSMRSNAHRRFKNEADDQPPTYVEALRTSRPVFLPTLARIRRCFTERDIASRFSSNRSVWLDEITDVEGGRYNNTQRRSGTGQPNNSGGGGSTTSRV